MRPTIPRAVIASNELTFWSVKYEMRFGWLKCRAAILSMALAIALFAATPLRAEEVVLQLDPAQTHIQFTLGDILHTVHGTFNLKHGVVRFDSSTGKADGLVVVDVTSGETGNGSRDHKMHREVLQSAQFPEATFRPMQVRGAVSLHGDSQVAIDGVFSLHGADHPMTLTFMVHVHGNQLAASTHFIIPYQAWGLKNPSTLFLRVSDKVDVEIHTAGSLALPQSR